MPDIEMCMKDECPKATKCYRSEKSGTIPNEYSQAYGYKEDCTKENGYPHFMERWGR